LPKKTASKKANSKEKIKPKPKGTKYLLIIPAIICIVIIAFLLIPTGPDDTSVTESGAASAQLVVGSGIVQVKTSDGSWIDGENGTLLYQSDSVKTV